MFSRVKAKIQGSSKTSSKASSKAASKHSSPEPEAAAPAPAPAATTTATPAAAPATTTMSTGTHVKTVKVAGDVEVFYREAGVAKESNTVLLLHGFPSSSHQFRHLIPKLSGAGYHVVAPDLPGFGFTKVPEGYKFTFDALADAIESFVDTIGLKKYALYVFDYGAPTGFRLATRRPTAITAIVSQNGNAFEEGLGEAWAGFKAYWASGAEKERDAMRPFLTLDLTKFQYVTGEQDAHRIPPEAYTVDQYLLDNYSATAKENQLDLFYDYRKNVELYPTWHEYLRSHKPPVLAVWGKNDPLFVAPGAEAFKKVLPEAKVVFVDGGHFPLELHCDEIADHIVEFLKPLNLL